MYLRSFELGGKPKLGIPILEFPVFLLGTRLPPVFGRPSSSIKFERSTVMDLESAYRESELA